MRITEQRLVARAHTQIARTQQAVARSQEQVSSGLRVTRPSDDPFNVDRLLAARTELDLNTQYARNAGVAMTDLGATEAALARLGDLLARGNELTVQAANDALGPEERAAIALEVGALLADAIEIGNSQHLGRSLFAGQLTSTEPFTPDVAATPTAVTYNGDTGALEREIAQGERVSVNVTGNRVFPQLFDTLIDLRDHLLANDSAALQADVDALKDRLDEVLELRSEVGVTMLRVEDAQTRLADDSVRIRSTTAQIEEVDIAQAIVDLQLHRNAYEAALAVAGGTLGMSLLDFLR